MKHSFTYLCILTLAIPLAGQTTAPVISAELAQKLLDRIDSLEKRVAELEGTRAMAAAVPPPTLPPTLPPTIAANAAVSAPLVAPIVAPVVAPATPGGHDHGGAMNAGDQAPSYPSLKLSGFGDFNFSSTDQPGAKSGFNEGQFVLHMSSALSPRVSFFGEISLTARTDAGTGTPPVTGFNVEVERSIIRFDQSDYFKVSFGRFHTPINYWNTEFHHGSWLQTTISRPEMVQFGGRYIPVHFVGAMVEGAIPADGVNLNYNVGIGNGRGSIISRDGDAGDNNNNRAWLVNLFAKPDKLFGLQTGGSVYHDLITLPNGLNYYELITAGHLVWTKENPEFIAEFANINHEQARTTRDSNSQAFYVQLGYRLPFGQRLWKPYYRYEFIHAPATDGVFSVQGFPNLSGSTFGVRYDISSFAAIKAEYRDLRRAPGVPNTHGAFFQTSFTF